MSIIAELNKKSEEKFPQNKIILIDGRVLDCYPLTKEVPEKLEDDHLELDKTGQYLIIGRGKPSPTPQPSPTIEGKRQLFIDNAFYLLAHSERILSDSRMFLCPSLFRTDSPTRVLQDFTVPLWVSTLSGGSSPKTPCTPITKVVAALSITWPAVR